MNAGRGNARSRSLAQWAGVVALSCLSGCATPGSPTSANPPDQPQAIVAAYYAAINRRDLLVLPAYVAPDVRWYSVIDGERLLEVDSREALAEALETYFARFDETEIRLEAWLTAGETVAVRESSRWSDGVASGTGERLGVFELAAGRIVRVTYFLPAGSD